MSVLSACVQAILAEVAVECSSPPHRSGRSDRQRLHYAQSSHGLSQMSGDVPEGQRFSHIYLDRSEPVGDSGRMRIRLRTLAMSFDSLVHSIIVQEELGLELTNWHIFFDDAEMRDLLDFITIAYRHLAKQSHTGQYNARKWLEGVQRIFIQENLQYRVDQKGGVHFHRDHEFARATVAAISALQPQRYANSLDAFEKGLSALRDASPDGKGGIRGTFSAIEGLFALMVPGVRRLASGEVSRLRPLIERAYPGDRPAQDAGKEMLQSLGDWIDAAHHYRHEEGKPDTIAQPPLNLAVYLVSTGAAHLRWLAELDALTNSSQK